MGRSAQAEAVRGVRLGAMLRRLRGSVVELETANKQITLKNSQLRQKHAAAVAPGEMVVRRSLLARLQSQEKVLKPKDDELRTAGTALAEHAWCRC